MAGEKGYVLADVACAAERSRLDKLQAINDPATLQRLDQIGITRGMRCLEVGAGAGSIARELAERVGPPGEVVAADIDPRFLEAFAGANRRVLTHDLSAGPVPPADFDFAHARALLAHIEDLEGAARHLVESVRPGGWVLCEEPDYGACVACEADHPGASIFGEYLDGVLAGGRMDPFAGRHVYGALARAGLENLQSSATTEIVQGGGPRARYRRETMENVRELAIGAGRYTEESFQRLLDCLDDPTFHYVDVLWVGVWGRRPPKVRKRPLY
jgi:SAM-dependent methyltransferase